MTDEAKIELVAQILMDHWVILDDIDLVDAINHYLNWPELPEHDWQPWIVDGESPKSLATKIVNALNVP